MSLPAINIAKQSSGERSPKLQQAYNVKYTSELGLEVRKVASAVTTIQKSIGWDEMDLRIANRRLRLSNNPKVMVEDLKTKELLGYAILVPEEEEHSWYISQIAVMKDQQKKGLGRAIMQKIFDEARSYGVDKITLDTDGADEKLLKFYRSLHSESNGIRGTSTEAGLDRFGHPKKIFLYELLPSTK